MVVDGEEVDGRRVGPPPLPDHRPELVVGRLGHAAVGVLDDRHRRGAEDLDRHDQRPQHVVGDPPAGVADDVGVAEVQAEQGVDVEAGVHTGHHGQAADRHGIEPTEPVGVEPLGEPGVSYQKVLHNQGLAEA